ncbi:mitochondrial fission regulator 2 [Taeniopygia guttata]|uniref:Mitochondrial fission regulator n=1 Tax=Taeniopygia guttata TaxID=59729 RepID=H0ZKP2_TAEGU|nr:mitochondrial fission regulator 2 [Taeniopygia guttata]XP_012427962.3 mitochondrial fission regulator 2 [Taeniopygia guttata]XP_030125438.3 mitochondrial fission regulator 2 [Taeniopygia guttata]
MAQLLLQFLRRLLRYLGWPQHQAVFFETHVFGSSISRTLGTCLPSAVSPGGHLQHLYALIRNYQAKVTSVCKKKEYGSTRSVVRRLGTILSLEPYPRPYFQFVQDPSPLGYDEQSTAPAPVAPSLADVLWVANDEGQACTRLRTELRRKEKNTAPSDPYPRLDSIQHIPKNSAQNVSVDQAALQKISALEDELTFLRAQIAAIVSAQTLGSVSSQAFKTLDTPDGFYPLPAMTSTPLSVSHNHFVIPSPPPLPSGAPSGVDASNSALELIKQRRAARNSDTAAANSTDHQRTNNFPSMMDVLKDLNKVQLRAVERSPGGTPLSRPKKMQSSDWDPVAVLTHALKQKFAHKNDDEDDSLDKENNSFDSSPFSSPEVPVVGRCSLKPNAKPSLTRTDGVKHVPAWKARAQI